ncbi:MAG: stalk domain-containing protein [Syntrophomonas sp.]
MKMKRKTSMGLVLLLLFAMICPGQAWGVTTKSTEAPFSSGVANCLDDSQDNLMVQIPPKAFAKDITVKVYKKDAAAINVPKEYNVLRANDITFTNTNSVQETNSMIPLRVIYKFNKVDYQRASNMDESQPLGKLRIGYFNNVQRQWVMLPTTIFWDGETGEAEATANLGSGHYALLWDPHAAGANLSNMGDGKVRLLVNYTQVFSQVEPFIYNGRTMVPIGVISTNLGAQLTWYSEDQHAKILTDKRVVEIWVGNTRATKDGFVVEMQVPPMIVGNRTFVPLGFVGESIDADVIWDGVSRSVYVTRSAS